MRRRFLQGDDKLTKKPLIIYDYNPMNDVLFKFIFGTEENKWIAIAFINAVLNDGAEEERIVVDLIFGNAEIVPTIDDGKLTRLDVFCVLQNGEQLDIEVQLVNRYNMGERTLYYWAQMYVATLKEGQNYRDTKPVITINLLGYNFLPQDKPHNIYGVYDKATGHKLTDRLELHFIEIKKAKKKDIAKMTHLEKWMAFFSEDVFGKEEKEVLAMSETAIRGAMDAAGLFMQDDAKRLQYLNRQMAIMDYNNDMISSREDGYSRGRNEGITAMIQGLLKAGTPVEYIMKASGRTREQIEALRE